MITWKDLYTVLTAVVPLYVAMILAYGSVRWWKIFSPDQCSGINRFVAVFAVPLLSFHFISANDIYAMNFRFVAADTLQKLIVLLVLVLWANLSRNGSLDWAITIFSLSTLPNTLVMGIPLLIAMYAGSGGPDPKSLMVQVVVLQCIIWYTLLLFLFEFRAAKLLIMEQFPETAAAIISFKVDPDVVSLDGGPGFLETDAEIREDGKLRVTVRKSNASRRSLGPCSVPAFTPRPSNLSDVEIYSMSSSRNPTPRGSNFNNSDCYSMMGFQGRPSNFGQADVHNVQSSTGPTPRTSNYVENWVVPAPRFGYNPAQTVPAPYPAPDPELSSVRKKKSVHDGKELHMFVWSACESPGSEAGGVFGGPEMGQSERFGGSEEAVKEIRMLVADHPETGERKAMTVKVEEEPRYEYEERERVEGGSRKQDSGGGKGKGMPAASVMSRLIMLMVWRKLVRNPNTYSSLIGLIWSLVAFRWDVRMPKIIEESIAILSDAGLGMAMFSLGLFMGLQAKIIACGKSAAVLAMAVRFLLGPAVMAVASTVVGLRGTLLHIAIVQAALPQGIVPFVFAKEYNLHPAILSTAVIFGMLIALPITLVYYILLGL